MGQQIPWPRTNDRDKLIARILSVLTMFGLTIQRGFLAHIERDKLKGIIKSFEEAKASWQTTPPKEKKPIERGAYLLEEVYRRIKLYNSGRTDIVIATNSKGEAILERLLPPRPSAWCGKMAQAGEKKEDFV